MRGGYIRTRLDFLARLWFDYTVTTLYYTDIRSLAEPGLADRLSDERRKKLERIRSEQGRLYALAAGLFLKHLAGGAEIRYGEWGKPFIPGGVQFNLSHSGHFACCAAAPSPVGVDIERWKERDFAALARRFFHPDEQAAFFHNPGARTFCGIWTLKESYLKMTGAGFSTPPESFCVLPGRREHTVVGRRCFFWAGDFFPGYSLSLCSTEDGEVETRPVDLTL
jgi:4'-phosphopantetheinyl transferase